MEMIKGIGWETLFALGNYTSLGGVGASYGELKKIVFS